MSKGGSSPQGASEWASAQSNAQITTWHAQDLYSSSIGSQERFNSLSLEQLGSISTPWALPPGWFTSSSQLNAIPVDYWANFGMVQRVYGHQGGYQFSDKDGNLRYEWLISRYSWFATSNEYSFSGASETNGFNLDLVDKITWDRIAKIGTVGPSSKLQQLLADTRLTSLPRFIYSKYGTAVDAVNSGDYVHYGAVDTYKVNIQGDYVWSDGYTGETQGAGNALQEVTSAQIRFYYGLTRYSGWSGLGVDFVSRLVSGQMVGITNAATFSNDQMKVMTANKLLALPLSNWDKFNSDQLNAIPVLEFGGLSSHGNSVSRLALLSASALSGLDAAHTLTFAPNDVLAIARSDVGVNGGSAKLGSLRHLEGALNVAVSGVMTAGMVASLHNDVWASMANNFTSGNSVAVSRATGFLNGLSQEAFQAIPVSALKVLDVSRTVNGAETYLLQGLDIAHASYLSTEQYNAITSSHLSNSTQIVFLRSARELSAANFTNALNTADWRQAPGSFLRSMTVAQLRLLSTSIMAQLSVVSLASLTLTQVRALTVSQLKALSGEQLANLSGLLKRSLIDLREVFTSSKVASVPSSFWSGVTSNFLNALTITAFQRIPFRAISRIPASALSNLDQAHFNSLTPQQIRGLTPTQVGAINGAWLNLYFLRNLPLGSFKGLQPQQMRRLYEYLFNTVDSNQVAGVTGQDLVVVNNRFATLAASIMDGDDGRELWLVASVKLLVQLNWLDLGSASTITRVQIGQDLSIDSSGTKLNGTTLAQLVAIANATNTDIFASIPDGAYAYLNWGWMSGTFLNAIDSMVFSGLQAKNIAQLNVDALARLDVVHVNVLTATQVAGLTSTQLTAMGRKLNFLAAPIVQNLTRTQIAGMTLNLSVLGDESSFLQSLSVQQYGYLTASQVGSMTIAQLQAIPLGGWYWMSGDDLNAIALDKFARLCQGGEGNSPLILNISREGLANLDAQHFNQLASAVVGYTSEQVRSLKLRLFANFTPAQATQILNVIGDDPADALILQVGLIKALATIDGSSNAMSNAIQTVLALRQTQPDMMTVDNLSVMLPVLQNQYHYVTLGRDALAVSNATAYYTTVFHNTLLPVWLSYLDGKVAQAVQPTITNYLAVWNALPTLNYRALAGFSDNVVVLSGQSKLWISSETQHFNIASRQLLIDKFDAAFDQVRKDLTAAHAKNGHLVAIVPWETMSIDERAAYIRQRVETLIGSDIENDVHSIVNNRSAKLNIAEKVGGIANTIGNMGFLMLSLGSVVNSIGWALNVDETLSKEGQEAQRAMAIMSALTYTAQALHIGVSMVIDAVWAKYNGQAYGDVGYQQAIWQRFTQGYVRYSKQTNAIVTRMQTDNTHYGDSGASKEMVSALKRFIIIQALEAKLGDALAKGTGNNEPITTYTAQFDDTGTRVLGIKENQTGRVVDQDLAEVITVKFERWKGWRVERAVTRLLTSDSLKRYFKTSGGSLATIQLTQGSETYLQVHNVLHNLVTDVFEDRFVVDTVPAQRNITTDATDGGVTDGGVAGFRPQPSDRVEIRQNINAWLAEGEIGGRNRAEFLQAIKDKYQELQIPLPIDADISGAVDTVLRDSLVTKVSESIRELNAMSDKGTGAFSATMDSFPQILSGALQEYPYSMINTQEDSALEAVIIHMLETARLNGLSVAASQGSRSELGQKIARLVESAKTQGVESMFSLEGLATFYHKMMLEAKELPEAYTPKSVRVGDKVYLLTASEYALMQETLGTVREEDGPHLRIKFDSEKELAQLFHIHHETHSTSPWTESLPPDVMVFDNALRELATSGALGDSMPEVVRTVIRFFDVEAFPYTLNGKDYFVPKFRTPISSMEEYVALIRQNPSLPPSVSPVELERLSMTLDRVLVGVDGKQGYLRELLAGEYADWIGNQKGRPANDVLVSFWSDYVTTTNRITHLDINIPGLVMSKDGVMSAYYPVVHDAVEKVKSLRAVEITGWWGAAIGESLVYRYQGGSSHANDSAQAIRTDVASFLRFSVQHWLNSIAQNGQVAGKAVNEVMKNMATALNISLDDLNTYTLADTISGHTNTPITEDSAVVSQVLKETVRSYATLTTAPVPVGLQLAAADAPQPVPDAARPVVNPVQHAAVAVVQIEDPLMQNVQRVLEKLIVQDKAALQASSDGNGVGITDDEVRVVIRRIAQEYNLNVAMQEQVLDPVLTQFKQGTVRFNRPSVAEAVPLNPVEVVVPAVRPVLPNLAVSSAGRFTAQQSQELALRAQVAQERAASLSKTRVRLNGLWGDVMDSARMVNADGLNVLDDLGNYNGLLGTRLLNYLYQRFSSDYADHRTVNPRLGYRGSVSPIIEADAPLKVLPVIESLGVKDMPGYTHERVRGLAIAYAQVLRVWITNSAHAFSTLPEVTAMLANTVDQEERVRLVSQLFMDSSSTVSIRAVQALLLEGLTSATPLDAQQVAQVLADSNQVDVNLISRDVALAYKQTLETTSNKLLTALADEKMTGVELTDGMLMKKIISDYGVGFPSSPRNGASTVADPAITVLGLTTIRDATQQAWETRLGPVATPERLTQLRALLDAKLGSVAEIRATLQRLRGNVDTVVGNIEALSDPNSIQGRELVQRLLTMYKDGSLDNAIIRGNPYNATGPVSQRDRAYHIANLLAWQGVSQGRYATIASTMFDNFLSGKLDTDIKAGRTAGGDHPVTAEERNRYIRERLARLISTTLLDDYARVVQESIAAHQDGSMDATIRNDSVRYSYYDASAPIADNHRKSYFAHQLDTQNLDGGDRPIARLYLASMAQELGVATLPDGQAFVGGDVAVEPPLDQVRPKPTLATQFIEAYGGVDGILLIARTGEDLDTFTREFMRNTGVPFDTTTVKDLHQAIMKLVTDPTASQSATVNLLALADNTGSSSLRLAKWLAQNVGRQTEILQMLSVATKTDPQYTKMIAFVNKIRQDMAEGLLGKTLEFREANLKAALSRFGVYPSDMTALLQAATVDVYDGTPLGSYAYNNRVRELRDSITGTETTAGILSEFKAVGAGAPRADGAPQAMSMLNFLKIGITGTTDVLYAAKYKALIYRLASLYRLNNLGSVARQAEFNVKVRALLLQVDDGSFGGASAEVVKDLMVQLRKDIAEALSLPAVPGITDTGEERYLLPSISFTIATIKGNTVDRVQDFIKRLPADYENGRVVRLADLQYAANVYLRRVYSAAKVNDDVALDLAIKAKLPAERVAQEIKTRLAQDVNLRVEDVLPNVLKDEMFKLGINADVASVQEYYMHEVDYALVDSIRRLDNDRAGGRLVMSAEHGTQIWKMISNPNAATWDPLVGKLHATFKAQGEASAALRTNIKEQLRVLGVGKDVVGNDENLNRLVTKYYAAVVARNGGVVDPNVQAARPPQVVPVKPLPVPRRSVSIEGLDTELASMEELGFETRGNGRNQTLQPIVPEPIARPVTPEIEVLPVQVEDRPPPQTEGGRDVVYDATAHIDELSLEARSPLDTRRGRPRLEFSEQTPPPADAPEIEAVASTRTARIGNLGGAIFSVGMMVFGAISGLAGIGFGIAGIISAASDKNLSDHQRILAITMDAVRVASSVVMVGTSIVQAVERVASVVVNVAKTASTVAKATKIASAAGVASTILGGIGNVVGIGTSVYAIGMASAALSGAQDDGSKLLAGLQMLDGVMQLVINVIGMAVLALGPGLGTLLNVVVTLVGLLIPNWASVGLAVQYSDKIDELRGDGLNKEAEVMEVYYRIAALDATPIVNWGSTVYTKNEKNDFKGGMDKAWFDQAAEERQLYGFSHSKALRNQFDKMTEGIDSKAVGSSVQASSGMTRLRLTRANVVSLSTDELGYFMEMNDPKKAVIRGAYLYTYGTAQYRPTVLLSAEVNGNQLTLTFSREMLDISSATFMANALSSGSLVLKLNGVDISSHVNLSGVRVSKSEVSTGTYGRLTFSLSMAVGNNDVLSVSYVRPSDVAHRLKDVTGSDLGSFADIGVVNMQAAVKPAPTLSEAVGNDQDVMLTFNRALNGLDGYIASANQFVVRANGTVVNVSSVAVNGAIVTLRLAKSLGANTAVSVLYTAPSSGHAVLQSAGDNVAVSSFGVAKSVLNITAATSAYRLGWTEYNQFSPVVKGLGVNGNKDGANKSSTADLNGEDYTVYADSTAAAAGTSRLRVVKVANAANEIDAYSVSRAVGNNDKVLIDGSASLGTLNLTVTTSDMTVLGGQGTNVYTVSRSAWNSMHIVASRQGDSDVNLLYLNADEDEGASVVVNQVDLDRLLASGWSSTGSVASFRVMGSSDNRDVVRGTRDGQTYYAGGNKADVELWGDDVSVSVGESASVKLHGKDAKLLLDLDMWRGLGNAAPDANVVNEMRGNYGLGSILNVNPTGSLMSQLTGHVGVHYTVVNHVDSANFTVRVGGSLVNVSNVSVNGAVVTLTLASAVSSNANVQVSYANSQTSEGGLQDSSGNWVNSFADVNAYNGTGDVVPPVLLNAKVLNGDLTLTFSKSLTATGGLLPPVSAFTVRVNGAVVGVNGLTVNGSEVRLSLNGLVNSANQVVTVDYSDLTSGDDGGGVLQDLAGNDVAAFASQTVVNLNGAAAPIGDTVAPSLVSAQTYDVTTDSRGNILANPASYVRLTFDRDLDESGYGFMGGYLFTVRSDGTVIGVNGVNISGRVATLILSRSLLGALDSSRTVTVSYAPSSGVVGMLSSVDGVLASGFSNSPVTLGVAPSLDRTLPVLLSVKTYDNFGSYIELVFDKTLGNLGEDVPLATQFSLQAHGTAVGLSVVRVEGKVLTLALDSSVVSAIQTYGSGEVRLSYTKGSADRAGIQDWNGNLLGDFMRYVGVKAVPSGVADRSAPVLASVAVSGTTLIMIFDKNLNSLLGNVPQASQFSVTADGTQIAVNSVAVSNNSVSVSLASEVLPNQVVTLNYTNTRTATDTRTLQDWNGNDVGNLSGVSVVNGSGDHLAPLLRSVVVVGNQLALTFSEVLRGDTGYMPALSAFVVTVGGVNNVVNVSNAVYSGATLTLTLTRAVRAKDMVTVAYVQPVSELAVLQDVAGNDVLSFSGLTAVNQTRDVTPPVVTSAAVQDKNLVVIFSEKLDPTQLPSLSSFVVHVVLSNGVSYTVDLASGSLSGNKLNLTLNNSVPVGASIYLTYRNMSEGDYALQDLSGNMVGGVIRNFSAYSVTNYTGVDTTAPTIVSVSAADDAIVLNFSKVMNSVNVPSVNDVAVTVDGKVVSVSAISVSGQVATLRLSQRLSYGQSVILSYKEASSGVAVFQDTSGNSLGSFSPYQVTNSTQDSSPPLLSSVAEGVVVNGTRLTLAFSKALATLGSNTPSGSSFTVLVDGVENVVRDVLVTDNLATLVLSKMVSRGATVLVSYRDPGTPSVSDSAEVKEQKLKALQDKNGNHVGSISSQSVLNVTGVATLQGINAKDNQVVLTYDQVLDGATGHVADKSKFTVLVDGSAQSIQSMSVVDYQVTLSLTNRINAGSSVRVSYANAGGVATLQNLEGVAVRGFSGLSALNLSSDTSSANLLNTVVNGNTVSLTFDKGLLGAEGIFKTSYYADGQYERNSDGSLRLDADGQLQAKSSSNVNVRGFVNLMGSNNNDVYTIDDQSSVVESKRLRFIQLGEGDDVRVNANDKSGSLLLALGISGRATVTVGARSTLQVNSVKQADETTSKNSLSYLDSHKDQIILGSYSSLTAFLGGYEVVDATDVTSSFVGKIGDGRHEINVAGQSMSLEIERSASETTVKNTRYWSASLSDYQLFTFTSIRADQLWVGSKSDGTVVFRAQWQEGSTGFSNNDAVLNYQGGTNNVVFQVDAAVANQQASQINLAKLIEVMSASGFAAGAGARHLSDGTASNGANYSLYNVKDILSIAASVTVAGVLGLLLAYQIVNLPDSVTTVADGIPTSHHAAERFVDTQDKHYAQQPDDVSE